MSEVRREFEGKDLEAALHAAAASLGIHEPDLDYEIVEQGRRGLFGLGAKNVRVRVMPPIEPLDSIEPLPQKAVAASERSIPVEVPPAESKTEAPAKSPLSAAEAEKVEATVSRMLELMGLDVAIRAQVEGPGVTLELTGPDQQMLVKKDGELLSALQFVLNRMSRRAWPKVARVDLSCNGRRTSRDDDVIELVKEVAQQVSRTGKAKRLHPMNAYERRLVHLTVRKHGDLGSRSEGDGPLKTVRIFKQGERQGRPRQGRRRRRNA